MQQERVVVRDEAVSLKRISVRLLRVFVFGIVNVFLKNRLSTIRSCLHLIALHDIEQSSSDQQNVDRLPQKTKMSFFGF